MSDLFEIPSQARGAWVALKQIRVGFVEALGAEMLRVFLSDWGRGGFEGAGPNRVAGVGPRTLPPRSKRAAPEGRRGSYGCWVQGRIRLHRKQSQICGWCASNRTDLTKQTANFHCKQWRLTFDGSVSFGWVQTRPEICGPIEYAPSVPFLGLRC